MPSNKQISEIIAPSLLAWYDRHRRDLPWRSPPGAIADPYHVWLSEIMLQQTTVVTVRDYFLRFLARWPRIEDLAAAPLDDVLTEWAGLGYYARARNLHKCAAAVAGDLGGEFPAEREQLLKLPGIGPYTAAAISAIAFGRPEAVMDGNVERVMSRVFRETDPLPGVKPILFAHAASCTPAERPGDYAQAVMDLGATICVPKSPKCTICPLVNLCTGRDIAPDLPRKTPKKAKPTRRGTAFFLQNEAGEILLRRRPEKGLLGGMMEIPSSDWLDAAPHPPAPAETSPLPAEGWTVLGGIVRHTFTHFHLELQVLSARTAPAEAPADCIWCAVDKLGEVALPTVMRKIVKHALLASG